MKILKLSVLASASALILSSCGGGLPAIVSTPIENIDTLPLKAAPLTEAQTKSWSATDLLQDTIPGMSVDRAYAEILQGRKGETVIVGVIDSGVDIEH